MSQKIEGKAIGFICDDETRARVKKIANDQGLTKSEAYRMLLAFGADVYEDLSAVGFVGLTKIFREAKHRITPDRRKVWDATR